MNDKLTIGIKNLPNNEEFINAKYRADRIIFLDFLGKKLAKHFLKCHNINVYELVDNDNYSIEIYKKYIDTKYLLDLKIFYNNKFYYIDTQISFTNKLVKNGILNMPRKDISSGYTKDIEWGYNKQALFELKFYPLLNNIWLIPNPTLKKYIFNNLIIEESKKSYLKYIIIKSLKSNEPIFIPSNEMKKYNFNDYFILDKTKDWREN